VGVITVIDGSVARVVNTLGRKPPGHVRQAVVILQATDELTGRPVQSAIQVTSTVVALTGRYAAGGIAGLIGVPSRAFPKLDSQPHALDVTVRVDGFSPSSQTVVVPSQAGFPGSFVGVDLGMVPLRRRPVAIDITTFDLGPNNRPRPLSAADVRITQVWRQVGTLGQAGAPAEMLSFPLGVTQRWPSGTALDSVSLLPPAEPVRRLVRGAAPGDTRVRVDRTGNLAAADLLGLDLADVDRREYLSVAAIVGPLDTTSPAEVETTGPVRTQHLDAATARRVPAPAAASADASLTEAAEPGDTTVFVDTTAAFGTVEILRATDAAIDDEYLDGHLYRVTTDANGFGRLPALSRVAAVEMTATRGGLNATAQFTLDYLHPTNSLQLTLH
jgi:hypothetical protein